jgi:hypothetical protein
MFEKIGNAAERLAANVSESRRGFLGRIGQAAVGVAGVVGGLLVLPSQVQAGNLDGYCEVQPLTGLTGNCVCKNPCRRAYKPTQCHPGASSRFSFILCQDRVSNTFHCDC